jgi:hypothetical protein
LSSRGSWSEHFYLRWFVWRLRWFMNFILFLNLFLFFLLLVKKLF